MASLFKPLTTIISIITITITTIIIITIIFIIISFSIINTDIIMMTKTTCGPGQRERIERRGSLGRKDRTLDLNS